MSTSRSSRSSDHVVAGNAIDNFAAAFPIDTEEDIEEPPQPQEDLQIPQDVLNEIIEEMDEAQDMPMESQPGAISQRLEEIRANFNPENILRSSKAQDTFKKHQSNHERFIVYLYFNASQYLYPEMYQALDDAIAEIDYSTVISRHRRYRRSGGKKSLEQRKMDYKVQLLRDEVKDALGTPGLPPPQRTVKLDDIQQDVKIFLGFLTECKKENGGLLRPGAYTAFRSSFMYLFYRYRHECSRQFEKDLKAAMEGVKRITTMAIQAGEGSIHDGDRALPWGLYEQFNKWFLAEGDADGIFAACFSKLTCNLACRGNSTAQICTKHIKWVDDCIEIPFAHGKDQQTGDNQLKKLPRHCYANPLNLASDLPSSIFHYFVMNPDVITNCEELLFRGVVKSQAERFGKIVKRVGKKYADIILQDFMIDIDEIGVHSWRKCAHTKLNTGSTAGPSGPAACIRGGHSMGKNRDVYIAHEKASDSYCGRILQGLPEHSPEFAVSYPDFVPLDLEQSLKDGVSETDLAERQKLVDIEVNDALDSIFGAENLQAFPTVRRILRIGLASHLFHLEKYDGPVYAADPRPIIPDTSQLKLTALYTNPRVQQLKQHVCIAMPWEAHYTYFKPASGIPPHVMLYAYIKSLDVQVQDIPNKIEQMLDRRQMAGPLSLDQIARAVENGPRIAGMASDLASLRQLIAANASGVASHGGSNDVVLDMRDTTAVTVQHANARLHRQYLHSDGKHRRVPPSWKFPKLSLQGMYQYWHCGDESKHVPPMKFLVASDVNFLGKRAKTSLYEMKKVMEVIDGEASRQGAPPHMHMSLREANTRYFRGERAIHTVVPDKTPSGRLRIISKMKWCTIVKYIYNGGGLGELPEAI